jgi:hypothetical protein
MPDLPSRPFRVDATSALRAAREHYAEGIGWLARRDVADRAESRAACAATATAFFAAGQLALAIGAAGHDPEEGSADAD